MFKLDLSKFKKIGSDKHSTTLLHPEGHVIKVAHAQLSPKLRGQLHELSLADGGEVEKPYHRELAPVDYKMPSMKESLDTVKAIKGEGPMPAGKLSHDDDVKMEDGGPVEKEASDSPKIDPKKAKEIQDSSQESGYQPERWKKNAEDAIKGAKKLLGFAKGGEVPKYADGTPDEPVQASSKDDSPDQIIADAAKQPQAPVTININGGQVPQGAMGQMSAAPSASSPGVSENSPSPQPQAAAPDQVAPAAQMPAQAPQTQPKQPAQQVSAASKAAPFDPYGTEAYRANLEKGIGEEKQASKNEARAASIQGAAEVAAQQKAQQDQALTQKSFSDHLTDINNARTNFQQAIQNQKIDPEKYWDDHSRLSTAIGLIMGGAAARGTFEKMMDQNISAQKANLAKNENLLAANNQQFHNEMDATNMTRLMQADYVSSKLKEAASAAMDPMAKARALHEAGLIDQKYAPIMSQLAMKQTLLSGMKDGRVSPENVIQAVVPEAEKAEAFKQLTAAQNSMSIRDNALATFDKANKENTIGGRIAHLGYEPASMAALKNLMGAVIRDNEGRVNEYEFNSVQRLFPEPGDSEKKIAEKRKGLDEFIRARAAHPLLKLYGINLEDSARFNTQGKNKYGEVPPQIPGVSAPKSAR